MDTGAKKFRYPARDPESHGVSESGLRTPVVLLIFNRPEKTEQVFRRIADVRPSTLLIVADGPRGGRPGEAQRCAEARKITEAVDWPCEVYRDYADRNLGCKRRVGSGLDWVFAQVHEAIILEDDCVPDLTFFRFCAELLEKYRDDKRVMMISGYNFQGSRGRTADSYYFSIYAKVWGWATWRRAWQHYDVEMRAWPLVRDGGWLTDVLRDPRLVAYWIAQLERVYRGEIDTWDYQWLLACWLQGGYCISPCENLVSNIGFDGEATHTKARSPLYGLEAGAMRFPLRHPPFVIRDTEADRYTEGVQGWRVPRWRRLLRRVGAARFRRLLRRSLNVDGRRRDMTAGRETGQETDRPSLALDTTRRLPLAASAELRRSVPPPVAPGPPDPVLALYNSVGILNYANVEVSGERHLVRNVLPPLVPSEVPVVVDVGANVGDFAELVLDALPKSRLYALEPNPHAFDRLAARLGSKGPDVHVRCVGASDVEREASIFSYESDLTTAHASLDPRVLTELHGAARISEIPCRLVRLDDFCETEAIDHVDLLKIDAEGHEYRALRGAERMLRERRVRCVLFEFNEMNVLERVFLRDFYELLTGFRFFRLNTRSLIPLGPYSPRNEIFQFQNILAVREDLPVTA